MPTYPYATSKRDYGPRKGTVGLDFHMTEGNGGDGDLRYLRLDPSGRGVSANFFSHRDGTIWRLLPWDHTAGTLNPADRSSDKGYYSDEILKSVLSGGRWTNPNVWVLSIEVGGKRADGPNDLQRDACIAWGLDMRERYGAELVGSFGHADQTDTKGCPGTTPNMKAIFEGIGGHGLFREDTVRKVTRRAGPTGSFTIKKPNIGYQYLELRTDAQKPADWTNERTGAVPVTIDPPLGGGTGNRKDGYHWVGGEAAFILATDVDFTPDAAPTDCSTQVAAAVAATKASAKIKDPTISFGP